MKLRLFCFDIADDWGSGWIRLGNFGHGLHFTTREPLFSERYGFRRPFMVIGKARFFRLKRRVL